MSNKKSKIKYVRYKLGSFNTINPKWNSVFANVDKNKTKYSESNVLQCGTFTNERVRIFFPSFVCLSEHVDSDLFNWRQIAEKHKHSEWLS